MKVQILTYLIGCSLAIGCASAPPSENPTQAGDTSVVPTQRDARASRQEVIINDLHQMPRQDPTSRPEPNFPAE